LILELHHRECLTTDSGEGYIGTMNITGTGKPCMKWNILDHFKDASFPLDGSADQAQNYCRMPKDDEVSTKPWCYTKTSRNGSDYWEYCDIPRCCVYFIF